MCLSVTTVRSVSRYGNLNAKSLIYQGHFAKEMHGTSIAIKRFDKLSLAWNEEDFYKEVALQWFVSLYFEPLNFLSVTKSPKIVDCFGACSQGDHPFIVSEFFSR